MRRLAMLTLLALGACTPHQIQVWQDWHDRNPRAAERFVEDGCAGMCTGDWIDVELPDSGLLELGDSGAWGQCAEWMNDALAAGWTEEQWGTLNWIMAAESNCEPGATSPAGARGLLQIMPFWADECGGGDLYDPWFNLSCGLHVYHQQGWGAWDVY